MPKAEGEGAAGSHPAGGENRNVDLSYWCYHQGGREMQSVFVLALIQSLIVSIVLALIWTGTLNV